MLEFLQSLSYNQLVYLSKQYGLGYGIGTKPVTIISKLYSLSLDVSEVRYLIDLYLYVHSSTQEKVDTLTQSLSIDTSESDVAMLEKCFLL